MKPYSTKINQKYEYQTNHQKSLTIQVLETPINEKNHNYEQRRAKVFLEFDSWLGFT